MQVGSTVRANKHETHEVMLLDDDQDMLDLIQVALERRGLHACGYRNPGDFFEAMSSARPSLVITDLHLDEFDGMEVCRRMTKEYPNVTLVVLSGDGGKHDIALQGGADLFLTKPIEAHALGDAVVSLLNPPSRASGTSRAGGHA